MHIAPPGYEEWESAFLNYVEIALNYRPQGLAHINITGWLAPEIGVALPGVIDAYIDDLEYFEGEDVALGEFLFPPAGTGVAFPDVRLPVTWNMDWGSGAWGRRGSMRGTPHTSRSPAALVSTSVHYAG